MSALTPAQFRARRARIRALGKGLVVVGVVGLGIATVVLLIDVYLIGLPATVSVACGAVVAPVAQIGAAAAACADALAQQAVTGVAFLIVGVLAGVAGAIIWGRSRD